MKKKESVNKRTKKLDKLQTGHEKTGQKAIKKTRLSVLFTTLFIGKTQAYQRVVKCTAGGMLVLW